MKRRRNERTAAEKRQELMAKPQESLEGEYLDPNAEIWREPHTVDKCIWHDCVYHADKWRWATNDRPNNANHIKLYMHCSQCLDEQPEDISPKEFQRVQVGWTDRGIQVWCVRHDTDVVHLDLRSVRLARAREAKG